MTEPLEDEDGAPYPEAVQAAVRERMAQAWDEGFRTSEQCWRETADIVTPDEERTSPFNPYRTPERKTP